MDHHGGGMGIPTGSDPGMAAHQQAMHLHQAAHEQAMHLHHQAVQHHHHQGADDAVAAGPYEGYGEHPHFTRAGMRPVPGRSRAGLIVFLAIFVAMFGIVVAVAVTVLSTFWSSPF